MLARCYTPTASPYAWYEAKGVTVCPLWRESAKAFIDWSINNGWKPGYDLDKDTKVPGNKEYSPEACCYIPHRENMIAVVGRQSGRRTHRLKLSAEQVSNIIAKKTAGVATTTLARNYGVSVGYVNALFRQAKDS